MVTRLQAAAVGRSDGECRAEKRLAAGLRLTWPGGFTYFLFEA